ncbi:hypothetical protein BESB_038320 [Besnoitia besnoiti]|uniref:SRS domain-containing protein n=1 Tax=Besnoitia besnoiti TaxID=94643 RepID=A0A2A9MJL8_BESBE|nr:hypothetical protein BESB_038320 [Besnoitia besnoiti]PFH37374.1 hypothetical protein BESB_038320 [Besnoitia besnoiti]
MTGIVWALLTLCVFSARCGYCTKQEIHDISEKECREGKVSLPLPADQDTLVFKCGNKFPKLDPVGGDTVYEDETKIKEQATQLGALLSGATLKPDASTQTNTLHVTERKQENVKLVYVCKKGASSAGAHSLSERLHEVDEREGLSGSSPDQCIVIINVDGKPQTAHPDVNLEKPHPEHQSQETPAPDTVYTCSPGHDADIVVSKPNADVKLKCADYPKLTLKPAEELNAFNGQDGKCGEVKPLATLAPGVKRTTPSEDGTYTLSVSSLPAGSESKAFCYRCEAEAGLSGKEAGQACEFRITVKPDGADESGVSRVNGSSVGFTSAAVFAVGVSTGFY